MDFGLISGVWGSKNYRCASRVEKDMMRCHYPRAYPSAEARDLPITQDLLYLLPVVGLCGAGRAYVQLAAPFEARAVGGWHSAYLTRHSAACAGARGGVRTRCRVSEILQHGPWSRPRVSLSVQLSAVSADNPHPGKL